jgi:hypothetical protein
MGTVAFAQYGAFDDKYHRMTECLSSEGRYWIDNDQWYLEADNFQQAIIINGKRKIGKLADFSGYQSEQLKNEMKYFLLYSMKNGLMSASSLYASYTAAIRRMGDLSSGGLQVDSFVDLGNGGGKTAYASNRPEKERRYQILKQDVVRFIQDYYDDRNEMEKDIWHAAHIPGTKISAAAKRQKFSMSFKNVPSHYREMVKRFMSRLVIKRSWSCCTEMMVYIRYFFEAFYANGYTDGFFERLARQDIEKYLGWVASDYEGKNATFRSKAISFIRHYIDYIQLAEYPQAPKKDVNRLIFEDDIPKRERSTDTMGKVKYVPEPVREQLKISKTLGRSEWEEKNRNYLQILEKMLARIQKEGLIHKNGSHREEFDV